MQRSVLDLVLTEPKLLKRGTRCIIASERVVDEIQASHNLGLARRRVNIDDKKKLVSFNQAHANSSVPLAPDQPLEIEVGRPIPRS